ncbi:MAG: hypothetical protein R3B94_09630 [Hyphomonas sp.]
MEAPQSVLNLAGELLAALAIGLIIGLERGWKERGDPATTVSRGFGRLA